MTTSTNCTSVDIRVPFCVPPNSSWHDVYPRSQTALRSRIIFPVRRGRASADRVSWCTNSLYAVADIRKRVASTGFPETIDASTKNQVPRIFPALCSDQDPPASTSVAAPRSQLLSQLARICGLVAGSVTIATGVSRILKAAPSLQWPEENLLDEVNDELWRRKLFLLNPGEILDLWAPLVFGALSFLTHFRLFEITTITCNFSRYSLWNLAQALYANFGYSGVLGLVGGALSTCTSCLSLISAVCLMDSQASLRLEIGLLPLPRTSRALKSDHNLEAVQVGP